MKEDVKCVYDSRLYSAAGKSDENLDKSVAVNVSVKKVEKEDVKKDTFKAFLNASFNRGQDKKSTKVQNHMLHILSILQSQSVKYFSINKVPITSLFNPLLLNQ